MDNIRNIKEKIKSCMSCNEDQCPFIKERLDRHVQSHNSSTGQTVTNQNLELVRSSGILTSRSAITMTTSSAQTSTSDLKTDQFDKRAKKPVYRKHLGELINEWANQLPSYSNASSENLKENIVNELIEKLNNISSEASEGYYDLKLGIEIDKFIDSLPSLSDKIETEFDFVHLKETLLKKICDLNENIFSKGMSRENKKQEHETEIKTKDNATNTLQSFKNNLKYTDRQNNETSTPYCSLSDNNESVTELNLENKIKVKKLVDAQAQQSFTSIKPFCGNIFKNSIYKFDKQKHTDVIENCYKQILSNWLQYLTKKLDKNEKNIIADAILNRLKPLLYKKYTMNQKILLKAEILNCLNDYTNMLIGPENYSQINKISEDLAVKLLVVKINNEEVISMLLEPYFQKGKEKMLQINFGNESNLDPIVQNIVQEKLENLGISNLIKRNIINIILQNIKLVCIQQDHYIETLIFDILQHYTELSDYCLSTLVRSILDQIRIVAASNYLQIYNSGSLNDSFKTCKPSLISVYKSEHELRCPNNMSFRRKSSDINHPQLTSEERKYVDNISELIKAWMTILPINSSKTTSLKNKESIVNNLAQDILDQVKLEQLVPETRMEKEKYLSFFIDRWLNRLNYFENISDAQPYTEKLIDKIKSIPGPSMSKDYNSNRPLDHVKEIITPTISCYKESYVHREPITNNARTNVKEQNRENTLKSEDILKEFIAKYVEHNYDEDNPITREVFGHILKRELQKLSTPTRKKVYGNLSNQVDNILASQKFATELQYINIISDWFKTLPLESSFNVIGNKQRAQYVNNLSKIISDLEGTRLKIPSQMDYNKHLKSTISQFTDKLPIIRQYSNDMSFLIDDFIDKINSLRRSSPCCEFANERDLSLNASSIPDQNLSDFIEAYIRENSEEIVDDQLKLDAWSLRIFEEVDNMASENPSALSTSEVYNRLANISEQGDDIGKRFNLELSYAKEISNWLNNLPLQPIVDTPARDLRVKMISNLAEKMSSRWHIKNMDPNNTQVDIDLADYIKKWIIELPLDPNKEVVLPFVIQQLLSRMERVNTGKQTLLLLQQQPQNDTSNMCPSPHYCCNRQAVHRLRTLDPGQAIVEAIEKWCKNLPIQSESGSDNITLLEEFSTRLFRKISELNKNPDYFNNNFLYMQSLAEEIDAGFDQLPQNPQLQKTRQNLKQQILDIIKENRNLMSEKAAGVEYRHELAKTIEMSLPNPGPLQPKHSPGFNIYKNCLVEMFILENFDYAQDNVKLNYVKRLRQKLDKYFQEVQKMNSLPLTKEQIFNELYSSLFSVPPPNEMSIVEEVEEVKTRCEIENWFESLPIREATGLVEIFEWDQILSMLAKRIHYMEKYEKKSDENIFKEIMKWLLRLPIMPGQNTNLNDLANDLLQRLKLTFNDRKCESHNRKMSREQPLINKNIGVFGTSQVAGPSSGGMPWLSPPSSPSPENFIKTPKRPSDLILDIVETWCEQLPLPENTQQEKDNAKLLKDNLVVKIIMKISELNANSETFENDVLYDVILDDELENLVSTLPPSYDLMQNKTELKHQLKYAIKEVKPLIKEEKERYEYKQELKNTVNQVLELSPTKSPEKNILLITLRDEIVDNFVAYSFCKDDEEGQEVHKTMVHDAVDKYYVGNKNTKGDGRPDPLMKGNQLLCELAKVPVPSARVILEEIHEIRMKFQIADLFKELSLTNDDPNKLAIKNQVKSTLARRLSDFDKTSISENHNKVKDNIMKCLKKIQNEIDPQKVDMFIEKLETSENRRKSQISPENNTNSGLPRQDTNNNFHTPYGAGENFANKENFEDQQWMSLLPATPRVLDPNYHDTIEVKEFRKTLGDAGSPQEIGNAFDRSINQSEISYDKFKKGGALSSSMIIKQQKSKKIDQSQSCSAGPSNNIVLSQGYQSMDNNASQILGSAHKNSGQPTILESHNIQQTLAQQMDNRPGLPKILISPQSQNSYSRSQQNIPALIRNRSHSFTINQPSQSQGSQQPIYMPTDHQNQMSTSTPKYQYDSMLIPSQLTLQNRDVPSQQNQHRAPSPYQQASASQNIPGSCQVSDTRPPQSEFSSQTPYPSPRCNKSCRRPSIALLKPPERHWSNNQDVHGNVSISDDSDGKCSCNNIKKKKCRGSPVCPLHMRKQCRICNGVNPFYYSTPPHRYYRY